MLALVASVGGSKIVGHIYSTSMHKLSDMM